MNTKKYPMLLTPVLDISEIPGIIEEYRKAAARAKEAGFDGVELSAGNGYLLDQFLQDGNNRRTDSYGGSIENRTRFLLKVVEAITLGRRSRRSAHRTGRYCSLRASLRGKEGLALTPYDRDTFYTFDSAGYNDYPSPTIGSALE